MQQVHDQVHRQRYLPPQQLVCSGPGSVTHSSPWNGFILVSAAVIDDAHPRGMGHAVVDPPSQCDETRVWKEACRRCSAKISVICKYHKFQCSAMSDLWKS
ncbi:hypothetical protein FF2_008835 [Malus domestica]